MRGVLVEGVRHADEATDDIRLTRFPGEEEHTVAVRRPARWDQLPALRAAAFSTLRHALRQAGRDTGGTPYARYREGSGDELDVELGLLVGQEPPPASLSVTLARVGTLETSSLPSGLAVEALHVGAHDALPLTYARMDEWARARGLRPLDELWELYETGPGSDPDPATWRTRVFLGVTSSDVLAGGPPASTG